MTFEYVIEILEKELLAINSPVLLECYPYMSKNGKREFKKHYNKQMKELTQAIKTLKESEE